MSGKKVYLNKSQVRAIVRQGAKQHNKSQVRAIESRTQKSTGGKRRVNLTLTGKTEKSLSKKYNKEFL